MASTIAWQISDDFESMLDDGEFDTQCEANEWLLEAVQTASKAYVQSLGKDIYSFQDGSAIAFNGSEYRVEVAS